MRKSGVVFIFLAVLFVLAIVFTVKMEKFNDSQVDCIGRGGSCYDIIGGATCKDHGDFLMNHPDGKCFIETEGEKIVNEDQICCMNIGK